MKISALIEKYKDWLLDKFGSIENTFFGIWLPSRYAPVIAMLVWTCFLILIQLLVAWVLQCE